MNRWFLGFLFANSTALSVFAQPGKNVEFTFYDRNPTLFLILLGAFVLLVIVLAVIFFKRRK